MKLKKCVITIGGLGTRMLPITKTVSKEMIPIIDVPTIFLQVKEAYLSGFKEIIFVVSKKNIDLIKSFFSIDNSLMKEIQGNKEKVKMMEEVLEIIKNMKFTYVIQKIRGTYGALWSARNYLKNETFGVMYGDDLVISDTPLLKQLIMEYERTNNMVVACRTLKEDELPNFGIVKYKDGNVLDNICYKDSINPSNDIIQGRFILNSDIFKVKNKLVYHSNELQLPTALLHFKDQVRCVVYEGLYFNIGSKLGYLKANIYFGLKRSDMHDELLNFIKEIKKSSSK
ncbi:MAG: hypothetical protein IJ501_06860 [Bacilli bacterium]|nr:hypothetical protein [Bacilli bacterium]